MWSNVVFAAFLLVLSAVLLARHVHLWRATSRHPPGEREYDYLRRQYRRRMQTSALIGAIGVAVLGGTWIRNPMPMLLYWGAVALVVLWIGVLALADVISTRYYYYELRKQHMAEHKALRAELQRIRRRGSNGKPEKESGDGRDREDV